MAWLNQLLIVVQVICAASIIVLILLQHGKGADMGAAFGSGASGSLFGASGSANFLSRTTGVLAAIFFLTTIAMAYTATSARVGRSDTGGVMSSAPKPAPAPAAPGDAGQAPAPAAPAGGAAGAPAGSAAPAPAGGESSTGGRPSDIPK